MLDEKINKKSIKKPIKVKMQVGMDFGWLLDRFWMDFGRVLEAKLDLKSITVGLWFGELSLAGCWVYFY